MGDIEQFVIPSFSEEKLADLKDKLKSVVYPNELEQDVGWAYGAPTWAVKPFVDQWLAFDWETSRAEMSQWRHYMATIDNLKVHLIHEPSDRQDAIPILLCHGWPSSFYEFHKLIEPLRDGHNGKQAFHVVVPSLPGYGFSEAPKSAGFGVAMMARTLNKLMLQLGYTKYVMHGGDWGSIIGKWIATHHSEHCCAFHTNMPLATPPWPTVRNLLRHPLSVAKYVGSLLLGSDRVYGSDQIKISGEKDRGAGYRAIQGTRPYTLAYGLSDSPVGLLAWMLEKYHDWSYHPPEHKDTETLPATIHPNEFLTQVALYWLTNSMSSSIRIYYECLLQNEIPRIVPLHVEVPVAACAFAHDIIRLPQDWIEASMNLHQYSEFETGGHFPALEVDQLLLADLQKFGQHLWRKAILT